jgi:hypothetical protein
MTAYALAGDEAKALAQWLRYQALQSTRAARKGA